MKISFSMVLILKRVKEEAEQKFLYIFFHACKFCSDCRLL